MLVGGSDEVVMWEWTASYAAVWRGTHKLPSFWVDDVGWMLGLFVAQVDPNRSGWWTTNPFAVLVCWASDEPEIS